jgi:suppressor of ftsI
MQSRLYPAVAGVLVVLVAGCDSDDSSFTRPTDFSNPPEISSVDGELNTTLTVAPVELTVAGERVQFDALYNDLYMPPVLRVQPGDTVRLMLDNESTQDTNVHYHGLLVSPMGNGDNVFLEIEPGEDFQYNVPIPANHPAGLFWYHPHVHPGVNHQIAGGLSGGLIVGNILAPFPELQNIPERIMLLKDLKTEDGAPANDPDPAGPTKRTINGLFKPQITMQPGQMEFWRIGNIGANIYYKLRLDGLLFYVIGQDGNLQNEALESQTLILPPGKRLELLVYGPADTNRIYELRTEAFSTGATDDDGDAYPAQLMATVASRGAEVAPIPVPAVFPVVPDLRDAVIDEQRTVVFANNDNPDDPNQFLIDDKPYDHMCVDTVVELGAIEEWTIQNTANESHVFHIHQVDFQVTEINGVEQTFTGYQDTVNLPAAADESAPSEVKVIIPFTDGVIPGEFVYHCHIVQHADQGMMANIVVVDPSDPPNPPIQLCD